MLIQYLFLVLLCVEVVSSALIIPPGMQRKNQGESCTFQWTVQGSLTNYSVYKIPERSLSANANHARDVASGIISLTIRNIQLQDAGNYSLSINVGTSTTTDNGALLFVYGATKSLITQANGSTPATEGSSVELTCQVTSTSLPASYRPKLYYFWRVGDIPSLQNISSGPNGDLLVGYSIKNQDRTFVIDSVQYRDREIRCWGQEEGTSYTCCSAIHTLELHYRPQVLSRSPPNGRFHTDVGNQVQLSFIVDAIPATTSGTWIFVSTDGIETSLPPYDADDYYSLSFNLTLQTYYGNYTATVTNSIGSTIEIFQVLPPAPSDPPSHFRVAYATHRQILLYWNCMSFNGRQQTISVQLKETASNTEIEALNNTVADTNCYNSTKATLFENSIRPETSYVVSIWSSNAIGSSDITKLAVKTPKRFKLVVSPNTIAINGTQATINFSPLYGNMTYISVTCCSESTGICSSSNYSITNAVYRVVFSNLPDGDVYLFDFTVYGGESRYYLTMVKGIRVSRTGDDDDTTPWLIATVVLAILLLIAVLALVGSLLFFLVKRKQPRPDPPKLPAIEEKAPLPELPKRPLPERKSEKKSEGNSERKSERKSEKKPEGKSERKSEKKSEEKSEKKAERKSVLSVAQKPPPVDDGAEGETYECPDAPKSPDDDFYMPLNEKVNEEPTRAKINQYS